MPKPPEPPRAHIREIAPGVRMIESSPEHYAAQGASIIDGSLEDDFTVVKCSEPVATFIDWYARAHGVSEIEATRRAAQSLEAQVRRMRSDTVQHGDSFQQEVERAQGMMHIALTSEEFAGLSAFTKLGPDEDYDTLTVEAVKRALRAVSGGLATVPPENDGTR